MSPDRRFWLGLLLIVGLALTFRVGYVAVVKGDGLDTCDRELCGDAIYYSSQAKRLSDGHLFTHPETGDPAADHPPLTSLTLAPLSLLIDGSFIQRLGMAVVGAAAVGVIGLLGRQVAGDRAGLIAAGLAAAYPNLWMNDVIVMAEALTALLVAAVLLAVYRYRDGPTAGRAALIGVLVGLATLARSEQALLAVVIVVPMLLLMREQPIPTRIGRCAIVAATSLAVVAPWVALNLGRFDEPTTISTNDGLTLLGANCDRVYRGPATGFWSLDCALAVDLTGDPSTVSARQREAALEFIGNHQSDLPRVVLIRVARVWSLYAPDQMAWLNQGEGRERWASWAGFWSYLVVLPLAVAGAVVLHRRKVPIWPLLGTAVIVTFTAAAFYGIVRFRVPAEVALVVLAATMLDAIWSKASARRSPGPASA